MKETIAVATVVRVEEFLVAKIIWQTVVQPKADQTPYIATTTTKATTN